MSMNERTMGEMSDAERLRDLPKDLMQDIKRAAYESKVREMEEAARRVGSAHETAHDHPQTQE